jgi:hypothetical protein
MLNKSKKITFTNNYGLNFFPPKPAIKEIPEWYKDTPEYGENQGKKIIENSITPHTIKKCMPVLDAITAGYILYTQVDVQVSKQDGLTYYTWPSQDAISFHPLEQAPLHPKKNELPYPKWNNPYGISTPPGYSVLFTQPFHRDSLFTIFDAVVDTDKYKSPVAIPFTMNNLDWEGIIPAGTPMVQVIPFKRESWQHDLGSDKEREEQEKTKSQLISLFFNSYKKQFWSRKEYK